MKIILSPAKKMNVDSDTLSYKGLPVYLEQTEEIAAWLKEKNFEELKQLWKCNEKIAGQNMERLKNMDLYRNLTPAVLSYEGIAYQYMAPAVFEDRQLSYVQEHLRILSAFYGVLKPMDGVTPYRLEMQAKASIGSAKDIPNAWKNIYRMRTPILHVFSGKKFRESLSPKELMPRWPGGRWCGLWQKGMWRLQKG